jgi:hypothetical protein
MRSIIGLMCTTALVALLSNAEFAVAAGQTIGSPEGSTVQGQVAQSTQPGMMSPHMTGNGMMGQGMMQTSTDEMPKMRMHQHMMKIMLALVDTNGDAAVSFEELTTIERRVFDQIDANKDGKVTLEEMQAFMQE